MKIFYSPNKHGRRINNTNVIKTTQLQSRQKHLKLDQNLDTRLAHNTLNAALPMGVSDWPLLCSGLDKTQSSRDVRIV